MISRSINFTGSLNTFNCFVNRQYLASVNNKLAKLCGTHEADVAFSGGVSSMHQYL